MNKKEFLAASIGVLSLIMGILVVRFMWQVPPDAVPVTPLDLPAWDHTVSGPYLYKNLSLYLIHGKDTLTGRTPLTLEEAMDRKLVIVHETSEVNELEIENLSKTDEVYVQAGDIVKGGKQDRVLAVDLIVPARSGRLPIDSFCVEQGRWTQRRAESASHFETSTDAVASKELKMAAKHSKSQTEVWARVAGDQEKMSASANTSVRSADSRSSLQLSLENPAVRQSADEYKNALSGIVAGKTDVVGFVFAIDGQINSSDIYGSNSLFIKLWPRLLKATAIEAASEYRPAATGRPVTAGDLETFFVDAETAPITLTQPVTERISMITRESRKTVFMETRDLEQRWAWIHRNYLSR